MLTKDFVLLDSVLLNMFENLGAVKIQKCTSEIIKLLSDEHLCQPDSFNSTCIRSSVQTGENLSTILMKSYKFKQHRKTTHKAIAFNIITVPKHQIFWIRKFLRKVIRTLKIVKRDPDSSGSDLGHVRTKTTRTMKRRKEQKRRSAHLHCSSTRQEQQEVR